MSVFKSLNQMVRPSTSALWSARKGIASGQPGASEDSSAPRDNSELDLVVLSRESLMELDASSGEHCPWKNEELLYTFDDNDTQEEETTYDLHEDDYQLDIYEGEQGDFSPDYAQQLANNFSMFSTMA